MYTYLSTCNYKTITYSCLFDTCNYKDTDWDQSIQLETAFLKWLFLMYLDLQWIY